MRVLFVTHSFPRTHGDAPGSFILRLAHALRAHGLEIRVVAPSAPGLAAEESVDGIPVSRFRYAPRGWETLAYTGTMAEDVKRSPSAKFAMAGFLVGNRAAVRRETRSFRPAVVHAHWWFPGGLAATSATGSRGVPVVTTLHGSDVRLARTVRAAAPLFRRVLRASAVVTAVSRWLADEACVVSPSSAPLVEPMPAATELFHPGPARRRGLLFVGRLNLQKGIEPLLRAFARTSSGATLDVVGDGPLRGPMEALASHLGLAQRVRFHGALPQASLPDLYRKAVAVVVPSTGEGLGLVAVEALLCETPVIAFRSGGLTDVVEDAHSGLLVEPGDLEGLVRAMEAILADAGRAAMFGRAGRQRMLAVFSPENVATRYLDAYRAAIACRSRGDD